MEKPERDPENEHRQPKRKEVKKPKDENYDIRPLGLILHWFSLVNWLTLFRDTFFNRNIREVSTLEIRGFRNKAKTDAYSAGVEFLIKQKKKRIPLQGGMLKYLHEHLGFYINTKLDSYEIEQAKNMTFELGMPLHFVPWNDDAILQRTFGTDLLHPLNMSREKESYDIFITEDSAKPTGRKTILVMSICYTGVPVRFLENFETVTDEKWTNFHIPIITNNCHEPPQWSKGRLGYELVTAFSGNEFKKSNIFIEFFITPGRRLMIYDKLHLGGCLLDFMIEVKKAQNVLEAYHGNQQTFTVIHMPFNTTEEMDLDQFDDKLNEFYLVKNLGQVLSREIGVPFFSVDIYAKTHSIGLYQNKEKIGRAHV